jgi:PAS domain S-box-containing protein
MKRLDVAIEQAAEAIPTARKRPRQARSLKHIIGLLPFNRRTRQTRCTPAEEALRRLGTAIEQAAETIVITDATGTIEYVNPAFERITGFSREEAIGQNPRILKSGKQDATFYRQLWATLTRGEVWSGHLINKRKDGAFYEEEATISPVRDDYGRITHFIAVKQDVTARKQAEEALQRSEAKYRALFESSRDAIMILLPPDWRFTSANAATVELFGAKDEKEFTSLEPWGVSPERQPDGEHSSVKAQRMIATAMEKGSHFFEWTHQRITGEAFSATVLLTRVELEGKAGLQATVRDVTEHKRAEEKTVVLLEIAKDICGTFNLDDLLERVQQRTAALLPCDRVVTYYWDAARTVYRAIAWYGIPADLVTDTAAGEFHPGEEVVERSLAGETVLINDPARQTAVPAELLAHFRLTAVLLVPLMVRGRTVGALAALNAESGRHFDALQVQLFEGIAQQVGIAVEAADLYRAQQEEAEVSGALVRVGQELNASLDAHVLLDRLCQVTTEVLACDLSHTILWRPEEKAYVPVAQHGDTPEQWQSMRALKVPRDLVAPLLASLERDDVVQAKMAEHQDLPTMALPERYGIAVTLYMALRRGGEIVGIQTAGYRGKEQIFTPQQERIARGLTQIASLALQNARLVEDLEHANRLKADFLATMSHELRTPLNIIMGYNELLLESDLGPLTAEQAEALQQVGKSAHGLLDLINSTLDLSRFENGQMPLEQREIGLPDLISELDAETRGLLDNANLSFVWDVTPQLPPLHTDPGKLKVVLKNLIANAVKFTAAGSVVVGVRASNGGVEFSVADTGVGIRPEILPIIFEPFRQGEPTMTRRFGGVGLGLYIVRRLVDALGGTIQVESEVGCGSTFRVCIPTGD